MYISQHNSIHYALTVSPVISTTFVEQFWMTAKSKTINNVRYITATVAGKPVSISEASIRRLFSPQWKFLFHTIIHCLSSKSTSWDQIPTNIATAVICLATNQVYNFSKLIFDGMMRHLDAKKKFVMYPRFIPVFLTNQLKNVPVPLDHFPINALTTKVFSFMVKKGKKISGNVTLLFPSMLAQPTEDKGAVLERPSKTQPTPSPTHPKGSGGNHGGQSSSDRSLSGNEDDLTLQSVYDLCVSLCKQVTIQAKQIQDLKAQIKKLKKKARPVITHHKAWMKSVSMKTRLARKKSMQKKWMRKESVSKHGRKTTKSKPTTHKDQAFDDLDDLDAMDYMETEDAHNEKGVSTEDQVSTVKPDKGTDKLKVSTDKIGEGTDKPKVSTDKIDEGTAKLKSGNSDETATPTATPIVFRDDETIAEFLPLPKIHPKDKGKKVLEEEAESDAESEGVNEAERKFAQLANDEEISRKVQEEWETEEEKKKLAEEEATKAALIRDYDDIQARIEADSILAARLQEEEREKFTIEERAKLLHDTIAAQRKFLAQQSAAEIRSRPPTRTQLRNQMMTYLKNVGGKKHSDLKTKNFEEIQVLYEKVKRSDENFIAIGSAENERLIKDVNKKATGTKKGDSIKKESKEEESTRKRKLGTRKKMKLRKRRFKQNTSENDSEKENDELRLCLTIAPDKDKEVDYEILDKKYLIIQWKTGDDLNVVYQLVMDRYQDEIPEEFDRVLWGDLMIMFNPDDEDEFWNSQQDWNVLEFEEDSTMTLELISFVKKLVAELESEDSDGDEEDL
ncbi:hypothetical protein Tco_0864585 [Tanacetum coccineum]